MAAVNEIREFHIAKRTYPNLTKHVKFANFTWQGNTRILHRKKGIHIISKLSNNSITIYSCSQFKQFGLGWPLWHDEPHLIPALWQLHWLELHLPFLQPQGLNPTVFFPCPPTRESSRAISLANFRTVAAYFSLSTAFIPFHFSSTPSRSISLGVATGLSVK